MTDLIVFHSVVWAWNVRMSLWPIIKFC